jgi:hypothetical protein
MILRGVRPGPLNRVLCVVRRMSCTPRPPHTHYTPRRQTVDQHKSRSPAGVPKRRLLSGLGGGYAGKPENTSQHDDVTGLGCPPSTASAATQPPEARATSPARRRPPSPTAAAPTRTSRSCTATPPTSNPAAPAGRHDRLARSTRSSSAARRSTSPLRGCRDRAARSGTHAFRSEVTRQ